MKIGNSLPGKPKIIVELCQNHGGDRQVLKDMIYAAKENGADIVKGQLIFSDDLTHRPRFDEGEEEHNGVRKTIKRPYQAEFDRLKTLDLSEDDHRFFMDEANKVGITPMLTVFSRRRISLAMA
ncbi:MAG: N-acetylneuraminate synthase family protein [Patescibacteria group bacterium]